MYYHTPVPEEEVLGCDFVAANLMAIAFTIHKQSLAGCDYCNFHPDERAIEEAVSETLSGSQSLMSGGGVGTAVAKNKTLLERMEAAENVNTVAVDAVLQAGPLSNEDEYAIRLWIIKQAESYSPRASPMGHQLRTAYQSYSPRGGLLEPSPMGQQMRAAYVSVCEEKLLAGATSALDILPIDEADVVARARALRFKQNGSVGACLDGVVSDRRRQIGAYMKVKTKRKFRKDLDEHSLLTAETVYTIAHAQEKYRLSEQDVKELVEKAVETHLAGGDQHAAVFDAIIERCPEGEEFLSKSTRGEFCATIALTAFSHKGSEVQSLDLEVDLSRLYAGTTTGGVNIPYDSWRQLQSASRTL